MKIYQVEISNYCNLSCEYCPHSFQKREKGFMSFETFKNVVELAKKCDQTLLYLHNFGEPLLHPQLDQFILYASKNNIECSFYTNGVLFSEVIAKKLYGAGIRKISISNHSPNAETCVVSAIKAADVPIVIEEVYVPNKRHNWAGQISAEKCDYVCKFSKSPCIFERENAFVVLWNGDIASCCLDCEGASVEYRVTDILHNQKYSFKKFKLCNCCDLMRGYEDL